MYGRNLLIFSGLLLEFFSLRLISSYFLASPQKVSKNV